MDKSQIKYDLVKGIIEGKYSFKEVESKIASLENEFGKNFFDDYDINKKDKPWNRDYLNKLKDDAMAGMRSKQFILHIAEVSEYVHSQERQSEAINKKKRSMVGIAVGLTLALFLTVIIILIAK